MKKMFLSVLCLGFISFSWLQAKDNELSLAEAQILFHQNSSHSNIAVLNDAQMQEIQGEFWGLLGISFGLGVVDWLFNCTLNHRCKNFSVPPFKVRF